MKRIVFQATMLSGMLFLGLSGMDYNSNEVIEFVKGKEFVAYGLGEVRLFKDAQGFHVLKDGTVHDISYYFCPSDELTQQVLKMSDYELREFLGRNKPIFIELTVDEFNHVKNGERIVIKDFRKDKFMAQLSESNSGYIEVKMSGNEYVLHAQSRLLGGVDIPKILLCGGVVIFGIFTAGAGGVLVLPMLAGVGAAVGVVDTVAAVGAAGCALGLAGSGGIMAVGGIQEIAVELETNSAPTPTNHQPTTQSRSNATYQHVRNNHISATVSTPTARSNNSSTPFIPQGA